MRLITSILLFILCGCTDGLLRRRVPRAFLRFVLAKDLGERQRQIDSFDAQSRGGFEGAGAWNGGCGWGGGGRAGGKWGRPAGAGGCGPRVGGLGSASAPAGPSHSGMGAGGAQAGGAGAVQGPNSSVYVAGLPPNLSTWASLDVLFGAHGRVRKIKVGEASAEKGRSRAR